MTNFDTVRYKKMESILSEYPGLASAPAVIAEDTTLLLRKLEIEQYPAKEGAEQDGGNRHYHSASILIHN
jgi:hypothetical protein